MTTRLAFLTLALLGVAGLAQAQTTGSGAAYPNAPAEDVQAQQAMGEGPCGHHAAMTDEYGFRYDRRGDRLNARGCVIAPPVTPPGVRAIEN